MTSGPLRKSSSQLDRVLPLSAPELSSNEGETSPSEITRLREEVFLLQTLMDTIPDQIYFKDRNSRFTRINPAEAKVFGLSSPSEAVGLSDFDFFSAEHAAQAFRAEQEIVKTGLPLVGVEEKETKPDGSVRWVSTTKMPLRNTEGRIIGTFGVSRDITQRKYFEEQLARQAFYDLLTQLPNRALFMNRLQHLLRRNEGSESGRLFAVLYLDIDRFKGINDSLGHQAGDDLLRQVARRLQGCVRASDTLARLGGTNSRRYSNTSRAKWTPHALPRKSTKSCRRLFSSVKVRCSPRPASASRFPARTTSSPKTCCATQTRPCIARNPMVGRATKFSTWRCTSGRCR